MVTVLHFGGFDVENFGDLMLPLITEARLAGAGVSVTHVSPAGSSGPWRGCRPSCSVDDAKDRQEPHVLVGGGHLLHCDPATVAPYTRSPRLRSISYASLWIDAATKTRRSGGRLLFNAPGVPRSFPPVATPLVRWALNRADYLAVRDQGSKLRLQAAGVDTNIDVVPDTGLEMNRVWNRTTLTGAFAGVANRLRVREDRCVVFHVKRRYSTEEAPLLARRLLRLLDALRADGILLPLGPCHGDTTFAHEVSAHMSSGRHAVLEPRRLLEVASCLAGAILYIGSSLHGYLGAISFGRPGLIVASEERSGFCKFSGALELIGDSRASVTTWEAAEDRITSAGIPSPPDLTPCRARLDTHWARIRRELAVALTGPDHDRERAVLEPLLAGKPWRDGLMTLHQGTAVS